MDLLASYHSLCRSTSSDVKLPSSNSFSTEALNEFVKEAYLINSRITELVAYLRRIRSPYLTLTRPSRRQQHRTKAAAETDDVLTDNQRSQIDASTSQLISQLNAYISQLSDAESARLTLRRTILDKARNKRGLGALGRWAGGGAAVAQTAAEVEEEAEAEGVALVRQEILRYLRRHLEQAGAMQRHMVEVRLDREREKEASILHMTKSSAATIRATGPAYTASNEPVGSQGQAGAADALDLSQEQLQLFEKENSTMLKHYTDQLDQVKNVQATLYSISELQTQLAANLMEQTENIELLARDAELTEENVGKGNLQLKKAADRGSTAQMVFWSTCAFCTSLVVWDLIF